MPFHAVSPRHARSQGGGLTTEHQPPREGLRLQAAERFTKGEGSTASQRTCESASGRCRLWTVGLRCGATIQSPAYCRHRRIGRG